MCWVGFPCISQIPIGTLTDPANHLQIPLYTQSHCTLIPLCSHTALFLDVCSICDLCLIRQHNDLNQATQHNHNTTQHSHITTPTIIPLIALSTSFLPFLFPPTVFTPFSLFHFQEKFDNAFGFNELSNRTILQQLSTTWVVCESECEWECESECAA
jgi:hypothetical protein